MRTFIKSEAGITWVALLLITCLSVLLARVIPAMALVTTLTVILGYIKARLIFINFMELKANVKPYRIILEIWGALAVVIVLGSYWISVLQ
ncbi:MAG: cytochrome C oxidase subunit IV family protein [Coriobacteriales bacterium]|nr:cytochrome C oxidase subunit IV family protein [Coriobacteriales bacterium]MBQ6585224.1 cytochrome C oxidase subunit IV family protein [Coriobacteriales bacterium]